MHNVNTLCNLNFTNVVGNCNGPCGPCANSSTTTTPSWTGTVTNTITVPANGGRRSPT
ncbi:MAG: hypothetical protein IPP33_02490 [Flavobacteriales bacterium]|nr:hypothetical protein [Flavobacteriales bacterium]